MYLEVLTEAAQTSLAREQSSIFCKDSTNAVYVGTDPPTHQNFTRHDGFEMIREQWRAGTFGVPFPKWKILNK